MTSALIAITGGIGSGKSVVSRILRTMGFSVYDCDSRAKKLMDSDDSIKQSIASEISADVITIDGAIDRALLANIVFNDHAALQRLNSIVHSAVRNDIDKWGDACDSKPIKFVETAILYQSGIDSMVSEVWDVTASTELRIQRVMSRNGMSRHDVEQRIASQQYEPKRRHPHVSHIENGEADALLPRILQLLSDSIKNYSQQ
jgi:dephospho-CoA kinase